MGLGPNWSRGTKPALGQPQPFNFTVKTLEKIGDAAVVIINYPGCTEYNGDKLLVYDNYQKFLNLILTKEPVDPHFLQGSYSPVARFEPTHRGWRLAQAAAKALII